MSAVDAVAGLATVTLDELNETASLQTRVDRKYVLTVADAEAILVGLPAGTRVVDVAGELSPLYRSTYLDTPGLDAYLTSAHRRRLRWKVRTRTYVASSTSFLEVKTRRRTQTVKQRTPWAGGSASVVGDTEGRGYAASQLRGAGIHVDVSSLVPTLRTRYRRVTLLMPGGDARATVDSGLTWTTPTDDQAQTWTGHVVLETKSCAAPSALDRLLWQAGHRPQPLSKYAVGLAQLHPDLPHNRWHRLLAAHAA